MHKLICQIVNADDAQILDGFGIQDFMRCAVSFTEVSFGEVGLYLWMITRFLLLFFLFGIDPIIFHPHDKRRKR